MPLEKVLKYIGLKSITNNYQSYSKGKIRNIIDINQNKFSLKILPLICYEMIYSGKIFDNPYFDLIVNISEDGWFGNSIGPDQHFVKSIFRAIENNTFFLRSTNKGISAIIDNKGSVIKQLNRNEAGNIEFEVPLIKSNKIKNDLIFFALLITYLLIFLTYRKINAK